MSPQSFLVGVLLSSVGGGGNTSAGKRRFPPSVVLLSSLVLLLSFVSWLRSSSQAPTRVTHDMPECKAGVSTSFPEPSRERGSLFSTFSLPSGPVRLFSCPPGTYGTTPSEVWQCLPATGPAGTRAWALITGSGCGKPVMSDKDAEVLLRAYQGAREVFEWGSGGSTRVAASLPTLRKLVSVDSDPVWARMSDLSGKLPGVDVKMILVDINAQPNSWGMPGPLATEEGKRSYSSHLLSHPGDEFDIVLVDGRFRLACAASFVLKRLPPASKMVIHDFFDRPQYHAILPFVTLVERGDIIGVFQAKQGLTGDEWDALRKVYEDNRLTPA